MSKNKRSMISAAVVAVWYLANRALSVAAPVVSSQLAVKQFEDSNTAYAVSRFAYLFTGSGIPLLLLLAALLFIWWKPLREQFAKLAVVAIVTVTIIGGAAAPEADAYYDKQDWPEVHFILPNESAFFIPDVGANKEGQAAFGSEAYLEKNRIPAKRFQIPHTKLENSGWGVDYYVPAGRLIIVDRTPFTKEWVLGADRGTSATNQGMPCQDEDGLNITVGVAIGASVLEEDSPRFLYRFGVNPPEGDRSKPEIIFTSVFHARSLAEVMETVVRTRVQSLACEQVNAFGLDDVSANAGTIMEKLHENLNAYMKSVGIRMDYVGWADTFTFAPDVQDALNREFIANKLKNVLPTLETLADLRVKEGFAKGLGKRLPRTVLFPPDAAGALTGALLGNSMLSPPATPAK